MTINRTNVLQEIRLMRFKDLYEKQQSKKLTQAEAAELLGMSERTFRRCSRKYETEGAEGLADARLDKAAHNAAPTDEVSALLCLFETQYRQFNVSHFFDKYRLEHSGNRSYSWVKAALQNSGKVKQAKKRGEHRRKRPRASMAGMMLHQDASTHLWVPGIYWDLIVTMDDATSEIYSAFFVEEEGTWSSMQGVREVIEKKGLFCSFYSDRGAHYWHTPEAGGKVDKNNPTQFGRAMRQLGIEMIAAYSPEARGRSERMFGTLQGRLPQELAKANITKMHAANIYLKEAFIPDFNKRFMVEAEESDTVFISFTSLTSLTTLDNIFSLHEERKVHKDNTVRYKNLDLQIPKHDFRYSFQRAKVNVHEYQNGHMAIFYGPRCLGKFDSKGKLITNE